MTRAYAATAAVVLVVGVFAGSCAAGPLVSLSDTLVTLSGGAR